VAAATEAVAAAAAAFANDPRRRRLRGLPKMTCQGFTSRQKRDRKERKTKGEKKSSFFYLFASPKVKSFALFYGKGEVFLSLLPMDRISECIQRSPLSKQGPFSATLQLPP